MMCNKKIPTRPWPFGFQKLPTYSICGNTWLKHLVMHLCLKIVFPSKKKHIFTKSVAQFGGEEKTKICFIKTCKMLFYRNKF